MSTFVLQGSPSGRLPKIDYAKELNQEQLDVVLHGDGACLVLAGAGSGKTRTLTYRVAYLIEQGVDPASILLLTFTNKAAREMLERVKHLLGVGADGIWGGTFHSIGARLLRGFGDRLGYTASFSILDAEDANDLIKAVMKDLSIDHKARRFPSPSVVHDIISFARNTQMSFEEVLQIKHPNFFSFAGEIEEIGRQYQIRKKQANAMDFDDLLTNLLLILTDPEIGPAISHRFQYILVDEYQDTNAIQAKIVKAFASVHKRIMVVGDDAQSIYAFRGADVQNIISFPEEWQGSRMFHLLTNYRSSPQILELANESLTHNRGQFQKELHAVRAGGEKPKLVPCGSATEEARFVAEQILALRQQGTYLNNMAVLFRSSAHSQSLEFELMKRDIPYEYRGGQKFFERAHIKDVVSFLRVYGNPQDEIAWLRVLGLQQGIGATTATNIVDKLVKHGERRVEGEESEFRILMKKTVALPARAQEGWKEFVFIANEMIMKSPFPSSMIRAITASHYQDYLEREYPNWKERLEDLEQLALFAEQYTELSEFLSDISLYDEVVAEREEPSHSGQEKIILSTIHQAKGLEWDTVFIIHLTDQSFPSKRALTEEGGLEEERRLFYVAVTRARKRLFLSYPMTVGYDSLMFARISQFLDEVDPRLFERVQLTKAQSHQSIAIDHQSNYRHLNDVEGDGWSWDEPTIQIGADGERKMSAGNPKASVWKTTGSSKPKPRPGSFLRDIEDL